MVPWCLQFVRDRLFCLQVSPEQPVADGIVQASDRQVPVAGTVKVIKPDGTVEVYDRQVPVAELMAEFPKHLVCGSDSFYIGQKVKALSETDRLLVGETYFLLPRLFFASELTFIAVASLATSSSPAATAGGGFLKTSPFEVEKADSGRLRIRVSGEFVAGMLERRRVGDAPAEEVRRLVGNGVVTTARLERDYERLVGSARQWKPKLETIGESPEKRRRRIAGAPFGRRSSGVHRVREKQRQGNVGVKDKARK